MVEPLVPGPVLTVTGAIALGLQRRGIKLPTYIAPTSPAFDSVIAGSLVVVGLGSSAGSLAYEAVSEVTMSRVAAYSAWVIVGALVALALAYVAWKRRQSNDAPRRHAR
jgi:hypothetical protein